jgi:hypothetical protein
VEALYSVQFINSCAIITFNQFCKSLLVYESCLQVGLRQVYIEIKLLIVSYLTFITVEVDPGALH